MERMKRHTVQNSDSNKKQKFQNKITIIKLTKSVFEDLVNEIIYEIFAYLEFYHIYDGFIDLNKRFKKLLMNSNFPIQINLSIMSKTNFERYYKKFLLPNTHRINYLRLTNLFTVDIVFSPPRIIREFLQLERLVIDNINEKSFNKIFTGLIFLPKLHSLVIHITEYIKRPSTLFSEIFDLDKLKYCKITYRTNDDYEPWPISFDACDCSPIEHMVINAFFPFDSLNDLLSCLPKLRHLSINSLVNSHYTGIEMDEEEEPSVVLKHFKSVSFKLNSIDFDRFEELVKNYFSRVEVFRLTTECDGDYLDAQRWEQLISSSMPKLRIFDLNYYDYELKHLLTCDNLVNEFNSSFWIEKQWFFTYQHNWQEDANSGMFYSTNPYRRKDYSIYCDFNQQIFSQFNSVKHVRIYRNQTIANCINYFPNATELSMKMFFKTSYDSIPKALNCLVPLKNLRKLVIDCINFPFEQIIKLIRYTSNLHTLEVNILPFFEINPELIQQSRLFQYVSNRNKIKHLDLQVDCTLEKIQFIVGLFPKLESLKLRMKRKEINQIVRFLLSNNNTLTNDLFFLCLSEIPKRRLKTLNMLIKSENLLDNYHIKFVNHDLYLWW